jgi:hypothetical protein
MSVEIAEADIVVGKARALLEGMACGRAAYVYDWNGADGWVRPERYEALEADNFGGRLGSGRADPARLREDLADYRPEMGLANRDLAVAHHGAHEHAVAVSSLLADLAPRRQPVAGPLREMSRLVSLQWRSQLREMGAQQEAQALRAREWERVSALEAERAGLLERLAAAEAERAAEARHAEAERAAEARHAEAAAAVADARSAVAEARAAAAESRVGELAAALAGARAALEEEAARAIESDRRREEEAARAAAGIAEARALATSILATRRYRIGSAIARPLDAARALVDRSPRGR